MSHISKKILTEYGAKTESWTKNRIASNKRITNCRLDDVRVIIIFIIMVKRKRLSTPLVKHEDEIKPDEISSNHVVTPDSSSLSPRRRSQRLKSLPTVKDLDDCSPSVPDIAHSSASIKPDPVGSSNTGMVNIKPDPIGSSRHDSNVAASIKKSGSSEIESSNNVDPATLLLQYQMAIAVDGLAKLHPEVVEENVERKKKIFDTCGDRDSLTDSVISTMLSQNTTAANTREAFRRLKEEFPTWEKVAELSATNLTKLENTIKVAGLAKTRAERIHKILCTLQEERGEPSFHYLRDMSDEDIKVELRRFKGLGPKTISCVLMFSLARPEFPVDTHVLRISKSMKWIPSSSSRESAYDYLNQVVPPKLKMDLHCLLVTHGRHCHNCAANRKPQFPPKDGSKLVCPLVGLSKVTAASISKAMMNQVQKML